MGVPRKSTIFMGFSIIKTTKFWGYPHGHPHKYLRFRWGNGLLTTASSASCAWSNGSSYHFYPFFTGMVWLIPVPWKKNIRYWIAMSHRTFCIALNGVKTVSE